MRSIDEVIESIENEAYSWWFAAWNDEKNKVNNYEERVEYENKRADECRQFVIWLKELKKLRNENKELKERLESS